MRVADLRSGHDHASWRLPSRDLVVEVIPGPPGLRFRFSTRWNQELTWPIADPGAAADELILPNGAGLCVPRDDAFWRKELAGHGFDVSGGLSMPFWGYRTTHRTLTYLLTDELHSRLVVKSHHGRLFTELTHEFRKRDGLSTYEVDLVPAGPSPIEPALVYRRWLLDHDRFVTLREKIRKNPEVEKLLGAMHAYLWWDGRTAGALRKLHQLGVDRMLLNYDQNPSGNRYVVDKKLIKLAKSFGYLIGPYDTLDNIQDPHTADTPDSVFDEQLFRQGGIMKRDGTRQKGFHGRGYELSSEALKRASEPFLKERIDRYVAQGASCVFLDCDAFGDTYDDFDPAHPMTKAQDRANKLARLRYIGDTRHLVLGSETGVSWSVPVLDYAHGANTVTMWTLWKLLNDPDFTGSRARKGPRYWQQPPRLFKEVPASPEVYEALFDPVFRVPLYQAAFHDAIVTTERHDFSPVKLTGIVRDRTLLDLLYLAPPFWNLDLETLRAHGPRLRALNRFFSPLHRRCGTLPLTRFEWLTPDRLVQRTRFGDKLELTANFATSPYGALPAKSIAAHWLPDGPTEVFTPAPEPSGDLDLHAGPAAKSRGSGSR